MSPRTDEAQCRLTVRRRLAMGGLIMTTTLAAGMLISTPAFADGPARVDTRAELASALQDDTVSTVELNPGFSNDDSTNFIEISHSATLDLNGQDLDLSNILVDPGFTFTVADSADVGDEQNNGDTTNNLTVTSAEEDGNAVTLGNDATLRVEAAMIVSGDSASAGVGSAVGATSGQVVVEDNGYLTANGGASGGAGVGGALENRDSHLSVEVGQGTLYVRGGAGAAGVGGAVGGSGKSLTLHDGSVFAGYGDDEQATVVGAGTGGDEFGLLSIESGATFQVEENTQLDLPTGATVQNSGEIRLYGESAGTLSVTGSGTIVNHGTISGSGDGDVSARIASDVKITDHNYLLTFDGNGGTATTTSYRLLTGNYPSYPVIDAVPADENAYSFTGWNSSKDGSGSTVGPTTNLSTIAQSDGTSVDVKLFAKFARVPYATSTTLPDATVGVAYDQALPVAGDGLNTYEVYSSTDPESPVPGLPAGLTLNTQTGRISGTPTEAADRYVYFVVNGTVQGFVSFRLAVGGKPVFGTAALPAGTAGTAYSSYLTVSGDDTTTYAVVAGALPAGLQLDGASGRISGTPTSATSATATIRATNRFGSTDRAFSLSIAAAAVVSSAPVIASVPKTSVKFGHTLALAVTANSTLPVTYSIASGSLPKGVKLDASTGLISGTVGESGTFTVLVQAKNSVGSASTVVVISVPKVVELISTKGDVPAVKVGAAKVPLKVAGLKKGEHWTVRVDGKLVDRGTMKKAGTLAVSVKLKKAKKDTVHTIRIAGSRAVADPAKRAITTVTVTSLAAKKKLAVQSVRDQRGVKLVAIEKLAAKERVVITSKGKVIAKGKADAYGIFTFPQSKAGKGTKKLSVHGATAKRAGTLTVKNSKP